MNIIDAAADLAEKIKSSNEYLNIKKARKVIDSNPALKSKVERFRLKEQSLFESGVSPKAAGAELAVLLEELSRIPEIKSYLKSEKEFGALMHKVFSVISGTVESGLNQK